MKALEKSEFRTVRGYQLKNQKQSGLTSALEDYLEMVYRLCQKGDYIRVGKLSERLQVKPSSASKMIAKLVSMGYLAYDRYESILLTESGKAAGAFLFQRHLILEEFLNLIDSSNVLEEVELVEHTLSDSTVMKIEKLLEFFKQNPKVKKSMQNFIKK